VGARRGVNAVAAPRQAGGALSRARRGCCHSACCHPHHRLSLHSSPPIAVKKLAKKGLTPSQIGVILRDSHGIAQVKSVTGNKILRLLKKEGAYARQAVAAASGWGGGLQAKWQGACGLQVGSRRRRVCSWPAVTVDRLL